MIIHLKYNKHVTAPETSVSKKKLQRTKISFQRLWDCEHNITRNRFSHRKK